MAGNEKMHHEGESRCKVCHKMISSAETGRHDLGTCHQCGAAVISAGSMLKVQALPIPPLPSLLVKSPQLPAEPLHSSPVVPDASLERVEISSAKPALGGPSSPFPLIPVAIPGKTPTPTAPASYKDAGIRIGVIPRSPKTAAPVFHQPPSIPVEGSDSVNLSAPEEIPPAAEHSQTRAKRHRISGKRSRSGRKRWAILMLLFLLLIVIAFVVFAVFLASGGGKYLGVKGLAPDSIIREGKPPASRVFIQ